ncbi:MAG: hypothetical protein JSW61_07965 [Candidatus Thorarchaeota archaeon]|nr:MAG: hypothetical protein JSW61_07965 [Candidatus Thorarchaeota archaeon]
MSATSMPWSFYAIIVTFAIFFFSLNVYIATVLLAHPWASPYWLIGVVGGLIGLIFSYRMVRIHQRELIDRKKMQETETA